MKFPVLIMMVPLRPFQNKKVIVFFGNTQTRPRLIFRKRVDFLPVFLLSQERRVCVGRKI